MSRTVKRQTIVLHKKVKKQLTRPQKIGRNILLVVVMVAMIVTLRSGTFTEEQAYQKQLTDLGITQTSFQEGIVKEFRDVRYEEGDRKRDVLLETSLGGYPVMLRVSVYREGFLWFSTETDCVYLDLKTGKRQTGSFWSVYEQKNEIVQATGTTWGIEKAAYENVWDFPQLGLQNVMVIDRQQEENLWQVGIDCIDVETQMYRGGNLDLFTPDLIYTADTEIGTVTWLTIDETCAERGMTLTDEEAVELARRLAAGVHWKKVQ